MSEIPSSAPAGSASTPTQSTPGQSSPGQSTPGHSIPGHSIPGHLITVRPWLDPVVDDDGFDPRSRYVEVFWLGVLGPTATWLLRRLVAELERSPDGYVLDLPATAQAMGLSYTSGRSSPFSKALQRCVMFGLAHPIEGGLAVRRRVPAISFRHLRRMPESVQAAHADWLHTSIGVDELTRAHRLATTLIELGDDPSEIEHHLVAIGVSAAVAAEVADNAARLCDGCLSDGRLGEGLRPAG